MGRYAREPADALRSAKSKASYLRVSFKNTRETAMAIKGKGLMQAKSYLEQVREHQRAGALAEEVGRRDPGPAPEHGEQRRAQGSAARAAVHHARSGEPGPQVAPPHLPRARP